MLEAFNAARCISSAKTANFDNFVLCIQKQQISNKIRASGISNKKNKTILQEQPQNLIKKLFT